MAEPGVRRTGVTAALRHRDFRLFIAAFLVALTGSWTYNVALAVWIYDATGSLGWIAAVTAVRYVPALLFGPYAGVLAERFEKVRVMVGTDLGFAGLMLAMGTAMALDAPPWVVLVFAAVASAEVMLYEPAAAAMTPHLVPERHLASANTLRNTVDNITIVTGPAVGAALMLVGPPQVAIWVNGATSVVSAGLVWMIRKRQPGHDVSVDGGAWRQMLVGAGAILGNARVAVTVGYCFLAAFVLGTDTVLFVAASDRLLGTGADGYGYLLAGVGIGGLIAAPLVGRLASADRLAPVILAGMAVYTLPTAVLLVTHSPVVAFAAQLLRGGGALAVAVLGQTALQRALPSHQLARVFATFQTVLLLMILLGSGATSGLIGIGSLTLAIWVTGIGVFAVSLVGLPWLVQFDRVARLRRAELAPWIAIVRACDLFRAATDGSLVQLAGAAVEVILPAGTPVVSEGEEADAFYIVLDGTLAVSGTAAGGAPLEAPDLHAGDWFGEIGLIERIPRTATVTAASDVRLLRIDGETFVTALAAGAPSASMLATAAVRLGRSHPQRTLTTAALED